MTPDERGTLRVMLPDSYTMQITARSSRGPWHATLHGLRGVPLADGRSGRSPYEAAVLAVRTAAGDVQEGGLAERLAASLRMIGEEPQAVAAALGLADETR